MHGTFMTTRNTYARRVAITLSSISLLFLFSSAARAATIWNGPTILFSETTTNFNLAMNQDRMTGNVWITRDATHGIFNIKQEPAFVHFSSPVDTEWADGALTNYSSLTYHDWNTWAKGVHFGPPSTVGVDAVVHLISDDIYVGIKFTSWGGSAGLFAYQRTTPPPPSVTMTQIANKVVLSWTDATFSLQTATNAIGPYTTITNAVSPYTNIIVGVQGYFRLIK